MTQNSKNSDEFTTTVRGFFDGWAKHSQGVMIGVGVVFVLSLASVFYLNTQESGSSEARDAFYKARQAIDQELGAMATPKAKPSGAPAAPDSGASEMAYKKFDVDAKVSKGVALLREVIAKHPKTRAGYDARMTLGGLYLDHGDAVKAIPVYEDAAAHAPGKGEKSLAQYSLGYAYEGAQKYPEAVKAYQEALNSAGEGLKGDLLLALARSYEKNQDAAKAKSTYDQILAQMPNTPYAKSAQSYKALLE